ncbi:MAG: YheC/YheD family protein [Oscillospiraceae bacterium]|nr:YheC/YheD family protein [Oscillospiraceae bacterium]
MVLIGYMHYRKRPFGLNRAYAFAAAAGAEGARLLYFSPGAVDLEAGSVRGYVYERGGWTRTVSRLPDAVCNVVGFSRDSQNETADRLRGQVPFTHCAVGDKLTVFRNLQRYRAFSDYLIPSEKVLSARQVLRLLERYPELVLKPSWGCQGTGVYYLARENGTLRVFSGAEVPARGADETERFIEETIAGTEYLAQPYIRCRTKDGAPYDFRLHTQKDRRGRWAVSAVYPRISPDGGIVCNISRGGCVCALEPFLEREFGRDARAVRKTLEMFALQLAAQMEEIQAELYGETPGELGIDVGLDPERRLYIYEVNWRPGHPPVLGADLSVVRRSVGYAIYLAESRNQAGAALPDSQGPSEVVP